MGDDVISRMVFTQKRTVWRSSEQHVTNGLNEIIDEVLAAGKQSRESVPYMVAAGNTVMTHLFWVVLPESLRESPYVPAVQNVGPAFASDLGVNLPRESLVMLFPGVASYVGGDIVSGVSANGMWDSDETTLFIDIGTNGEIVAGIGTS